MAVARFGGVAAVVLVLAAVVGVGWSIGVAGASGSAVTATADTQPTAAPGPHSGVVVHRNRTAVERAPTPETDTTVTRIVVSPNGTATWNVEFRTRLESDAAVEDYRAFQTTFRNDTEAFLASFRTRIRDVVGDAEDATGREMTARNFTAETTIQQVPRRWGVVRYQFEWRGFARVDGDSLLVGDVFDGGFFLARNDTLVIGGPPASRVAVSEPQPDRASETVVRWSGRRSFADGRPSVVFRPVVTPTATPSPTPTTTSTRTPESTATPTRTASPSPTETGVGGGADSPTLTPSGSPSPAPAGEDGTETGSGLLDGRVDLLALLAVAGLVAVLLAFRSGLVGSTDGSLAGDADGSLAGDADDSLAGDADGSLDAPSGGTTSAGEDTAFTSSEVAGGEAVGSTSDGETDDDTEERETDSDASSSDDATPDDTAGGTVDTDATESGDEADELPAAYRAVLAEIRPPLTDEERVKQLLARNEGRLRQSAVADRLDWSASKTSRVLSGMADAGTVEKIRVGRENVVDLVVDDEE